MRCSQILQRKLEFDPEISHVTQDSRTVRPGSLFFCSKTGEEGRFYLNQARSRGAVVCVSGEEERNCLFSANPRRDYALACSRFWGEPQKKLKLIAVTGTNGKSSVAWMLHHILQNCGLIGTICSRFANQEIHSVYTTPDAGQLYPLLAQMVDSGCEYVVMEASSQAIAQHRLAGLEFELGIFTNLSPDHLDQHGTIEEYFAVKQSIFTQCKSALTNIDDDFGRILKENKNMTSYSLYSSGADYTVSNLQKSSSGSDFCLRNGMNRALVSLKMPGEFSVSNAVAALAAANLLGVPLQTVSKAIGDCPAVPGRAERVSMGDFDVIIDYAHTSDGLKNLFEMTENLHFKRLFVVFGCAGERDRRDRKAMTDTVLHYADRAIFTADNPRGESWEQICRDAAVNDTLCIYDRQKAIETALNWCESGDLLLLLGKGHENYQALSEKSIYFSEQECLEQWQKNHCKY